MCTKDVQFQLAEIIYCQTNGVVMGRPLNLILADIFMANLEKTKLERVIGGLVHYARYIEDTFIVCDDQQQTKHI